MHDDFHPYYVRTGDTWTRIDYSKPARDWMKPLVRGQETDLVEIPASWHLDDMVPLMFMKTVPNSQGFESPRVVEEIWRDAFDWVYRKHDYAIFPMTIHPDVSGRPQVLSMARAAVRAHALEARRALRHHARDRRRLQTPPAPRVIAREALTRPKGRATNSSGRDGSNAAPGPAAASPAMVQAIPRS